jgi:hypothetical protein
VLRATGPIDVRVEQEEDIVSPFGLAGQYSNNKVLYYIRENLMNY